MSDAPPNAGASLAGGGTPLVCRVCGAAIGLDQIHADLGLARCDHCGAVIDIQPRPSAGRRHRPQVPLPEKFQVRRQANLLVVRWRWFTALHLFLLLFCIVWDGFLIGFYRQILASGEAPTQVLLFPLIHVVVGVGLTYSTVAGLFNHTEVTVRPARLEIRHGPLPWFGGRSLVTASVSQLYVRRREIRTKNGGSRLLYELRAERKDGRAVTLLKNLTEPEQALWLEQEIESSLGIEDRPVGGEVSFG